MKPKRIDWIEWLKNVDEYYIDNYPLDSLVNQLPNKEVDKELGR